MKHGIDFEEAQAIWGDPRILAIRARHPYEARFLSIGVFDDRHWAAVWTERRDSVRIISARRARREEVRLHEGA